jgi:hypothetical protein
MSGVRTILLGLVVIVAPVRATAFRIIGAGTASCGTWMVDHREPYGILARMDDSWVAGFLSGVAWTRANELDPLNGLDANAVDGWISNYCVANPLDTIQQAAAKFVSAHPR